MKAEETLQQLEAEALAAVRKACAATPTDWDGWRRDNPSLAVGGYVLMLTASLGAEIVRDKRRRKGFTYIGKPGSTLRYEDAVFYWLRDGEYGHYITRKEALEWVGAWQPLPVPA